MLNTKVFVSKVTHEGQKVIKIFERGNLAAAIEYAKQIELDGFYLWVFTAFEENDRPVGAIRIYELFM